MIRIRRLKESRSLLAWNNGPHTHTCRKEEEDATVRMNRLAAVRQAANDDLVVVVMPVAGWVAEEGEEEVAGRITPVSIGVFGALWGKSKERQSR
jgi:hypothetical protein